MKSTSESILQWNEYVKQTNEAQKNSANQMAKKSDFGKHYSITEKRKQRNSRQLRMSVLEKELGFQRQEIFPCCAPEEMRKLLDTLETLKTQALKEVLLNNSYQTLVKNYKKIDLCKTCNMRKPN